MGTMSRRRQMLTLAMNNFRNVLKEQKLKTHFRNSMKKHWVQVSILRNTRKMQILSISFLAPNIRVLSYCFLLAKFPPTFPETCHLFMFIFSLFLCASFFPSAYEYAQYPLNLILRKTSSIPYHLLNMSSMFPSFSSSPKFLSL